MCHPKLKELEPKEKHTMQQHAAYNQQQWNHYNELIIEIYKGNYGDHYDYLLAELTDGPYWPLSRLALASQKKSTTLTRVSVAQESH